MDTGKEQISARQLMFSIACFIQASTLLTSYFSGTVEQEVWIVVIAGYLISLPIVWIYVLLAKKFPGKTIIEINDRVFGAVFGKVISVFYVYFFFSLAVISTGDLGRFINIFIMPETPSVAILFIFVAICAWVVHKGVETITRYGTVFVVSFFVVVTVSGVLLLKDIKTENLLPLLSFPLKNYVQGTHIVTMAPFCELFVFFMLFPNVKDTKKLGKALWGGLTIGAFSILIVVLRDVSVLGGLFSYIPSPIYQVTRIINVGHIFSRMEFLFGIMWVSLMYYKVGILFYGTVRGVGQLLHLRSYRILVPTFGALIISGALLVGGSVAEDINWGANFAAVYVTFFVLLLPAVTLIAAGIKDLLKKKEARVS